MTSLPPISPPHYQCEVASAADGAADGNETACRPQEVSKRHYHDVEFQMIYVLKNWISPVN